MPIKLLRRYALPCTLLALLTAAFAAPYLLPVSPDSPAFRSGTLSFLLLAACGFPVYDAFKNASARTLCWGLFWGLLMGIALSLGAELREYDMLLPGFGSLVRRLSTPVMVTPLFGCLAARLMMIRVPARQQPLRLPFAAYWAIIFLCWVPILLAYWPGMLNYDFPGQVTQHLTGIYDDSQPLLHTVLAGAFLSLGDLLDYRSRGLMLLSIFQMIVFSASLASCCTFAQRRKAPIWALLMMTALFGFHPIFSVMSVSMTKDTLFTACVIFVSLATAEMLTKPETLDKKRNWIGFVLALTGTVMLRNNGILVLVLMLPTALLASREKKRLLTLFGISAAFCFACTTLLNAVYQPASAPLRQAFSLPAQTIVRMYNVEELPNEERAEIESWYTEDIGLVLHPYLADGAKGYLNDVRLRENPGEFLSLWLRLCARYPKTAAEAFLMLNIGSWYPDDLTHSTIYLDASYVDIGYLQTDEYNMAEDDLICYSRFPQLRNFMERICRRNAYQGLPIVTLLFAPALPLFLVLLACAVLLARRQFAYLPCTLGVLALWGSQLFLSPCTLARYALPLFAIAPALLFVSLTLPEVSHD